MIINSNGGTKMKFFLYAISPLLFCQFSLGQPSLGGGLRDEPTLTEILRAIDVSNPEQSCPECGFNESSLVKEIKTYESKIDALSKILRDRLQSSGYDNSKMTDVQLAAQARDQIRLLNLEIGRQKMLVQSAKMELQTCRTGNNRSESIRQRTGTGTR